jgi:hypothetical protein
MPTVSFRVSQSDYLWLREEADKRGMSLSDLFRYAMQLRDVGESQTVQSIEELDRRLCRLESMAGL